MACHIAHVGHPIFYYWKACGYTVLEQFASSAPKQPHRNNPVLEQQVIALRHQHSDWSKQRSAHELSKAHQWQSVVSGNRVIRIPRTASLVHPRDLRTSYIWIARFSWLRMRIWHAYHRWGTSICISWVASALR